VAEITLNDDDSNLSKQYDTNGPSN
jgi:hypothetical protein